MHDTRLKTQVLVIGSGIAGSTSALTLADLGYDVTLVTAAEEPTWGNTALAQGGIVARAEDDDPKLLVGDILTAGWKHNYLRAVRHLAQKGPGVVQEMLVDRVQVPFSRKDDGGFQMTREGGHSKARILFCADFTGRAIMTSLGEAVEKHPNIRVLTKRTAIDFLTSHHNSDSLEFRYALTNQCLGAYLYNEHAENVETILAEYTVLATGGCGQVFLHTTNTSASIGSALSMGFRAGVKLMNLEYVQFHPTALFRRAERRFLVSEAVRGEGARLVNGKGEPFMHRYDPRADLAPRDIVTRSILEEMLKTGEDCVYLDAANYVQHDLTQRFPTIYRTCKSMGIDMTKEPIPVVPAAHYFCGGLLTDLGGRTTLERLYAVGECACTGVHGANRLASTSLLEGVLWGHEAGLDIARHLGRGRKSTVSRKLRDSVPDWRAVGTRTDVDPALVSQDWATIRQTMWNYVGITRTTPRLRRAFEDMRDLNKRLHDFYKETRIAKPIIDLFHGSQAAYQITIQALRNTTSLGCHYRVD